MGKRIIFIHGLGGEPIETWGKFPDLLRADEDVDFDVFCLGYRSPNLLKGLYQGAPSIANIANGLINELQTHHALSTDEIILASHSLGGIILKKIMLRLSDTKAIHRIQKVVFFDVPHDGSGFANVGQYLNFRNRHLKSLCRDSSELDDLNDQWIDKGFNQSLEILSVIADNDSIVSSLSSKSMFREHSIVTINNADHITIVKPADAKATVYLNFKQFVIAKSTVAKYRNAASRDLVDWQRIDRNHAYRYASDEKRKKSLEIMVEMLDSRLAAVRLIGASGLGKTRLLLEAIELSKKIDNSCVLVFNAPSYDKEIKEAVRNMVRDKVECLVIVENCSVELHNELARELVSTSANVKIVTVGYSNDQVDNSVVIQLFPLSDDAIKEMLSPILIDLNPDMLDRVARFSEGYPLMATLFAEQYQKNGRLLGSIENRSVVKKLIESDGDLSDQERQVLLACSVFDVFGTDEEQAGLEAKFIAEQVAGATVDVFNKVLKKFGARQIINTVGRYARVVPKPLAVTLASEWWKDSTHDRQKFLIAQMPDSLMDSFCTQAAYLDGQQEIQRFSDQLFGNKSPFIGAEELLTERGSKLFRAFTEVNPRITSEALYKTLVKLTPDELLAIQDSTRRNLVWGLEKLCFHAEYFEKSAWCMLLLAIAENESFSNNATGMFSQLFRVHLSGTAAHPNDRFALLRRGLSCNESRIDMVLLEALEQSVSVNGGSRAVGAEHQGTRPTLEEWHPKFYQDIYDFWQEAFNLLLVLFDRGAAQKQVVLNVIGHSIRQLVIAGRFEMLDIAIRKIVAANGRYWPAGLDGIKTAIEFDAADNEDAAKDYIKAWLELLDPKNGDMAERLQILVIGPPWEHKEVDGVGYVDIAAENAKVLATEVSENIDSFIQHLPLLLIGEQKQTFSFGYQLVCDLEESKSLIMHILTLMEEVLNARPELIVGMLKGLFEKSVPAWEFVIGSVVGNKKLSYLYPDLLRTGDIRPEHLQTLLKLILSGDLPTTSAKTLSYGRVIEDVSPEVLSVFCLDLANFDELGSWSALQVAYMYCHGRNDHFEQFRSTLKELVVKVPLHKRADRSTMDFHHWKDLVEQLLLERDAVLAVSIVNQMLSAIKIGFEHNNVWSYIKPMLIKLAVDYEDFIWPILSGAIVRAEGMDRYWLQQLMERETSFSNRSASVFSFIAKERVIDWCNNNIEVGPLFVAMCVNLFDGPAEQQTPSPLLISLLEHFGDNEKVSNSLHANMVSRGWSGSLVPYLQSDKNALSSLLLHENGKVRNWAKGHIANIDDQIQFEMLRDEERSIGHY